MTIRIAEDWNDDGTPIYTTTLQLKLGELMETDCIRRDAEIDQISASFEEIIGQQVTNDGLESAIISDAFFNCELTAGLVYHDGEYVGMRAAAEAFNAALPSPLKERYTPDWLVEDFNSRV